MASIYTDSMALRQTVEIPPDLPSNLNKDNSKHSGHVIGFGIPSADGVKPGEDPVSVESGEPASMEDNCDNSKHANTDPILTMSTTNKVAGQTVAPFLAKHIPQQYNPLGLGPRPVSSPQKNPNTKYCYRHRPDLKCRRTPDEPKMENLQRVCPATTASLICEYSSSLQELETLSQADQQGISHVWSLFSAAPAKHRNLMLQGILTQCCFPQLSYLSTAVRDLIRIDFLTALPSEISFKILCSLDTTSLCKAAQVSQKWRILADDDVVWHKMCEQHIDRKCVKCGWGLPLLERKRLRDWKRQQQLRGTGRGLNEWSPRLTPIPDDQSSPEVGALTLNGPGKRKAIEFAPDGSLFPEASKRLKSDPDDSYLSKPRFRPWKDVYKDRFKVGTNWKYGRYTERLFRGHTNGVMCLQFDDNILATGSYDSTIKIWNIDTGEEIRTLKGHTLGIRALQFDDTKLISGSLDKTVRIWNWRTGECISTHQAHTEGVIGLHFDGNLLASASIDRTVKIWNFENKQTFLLKGHTEWVNAVKIDSVSRTVFSASDDCTIRLWDLDTRQTIQTFEGHVGQVQQITLLPPEYEPDDVEAEDADDISTTSSDTLTDSHHPVTPLSATWPKDRALPARYMLTGALDNNLRLWDVYTGRCLKTLFGHLEGVWALAGDTLRIVSGAEDRIVKVWDARTGKCERTFTGHSGPVTCIGLSDSRLCTGSEDCEVRLYSFKAEGAEQVDEDLATPACSSTLSSIL